ncbi:hypothetical protein F4808DRAFT_422282 [Astrocystis sublimbata]|nr:hypothetical protein F4808DRAFT_422282 [Astrocystis sublimbata]
MRSSKPACLLCRLRVAKAASETTTKTRATQWRPPTAHTHHSHPHTQTARLSTTASRPEASGHDAAAPVSPHPHSRQPQNQSPQYMRRTLFNNKPHLKSQLRTPRPEAAGAQQSSARVDALFQQILQEQHGLAQDRAAAAPAHSHASVDLSLVQAIGHLQDMVEDESTPVASAYAYYNSEIAPLAQQAGTHVPQAYHRLRFVLLEKLAAAKRADMFTDALPTVADICRAYAEVGELKPKQWTALVAELVRCIIKTGPASNKAQSGLEHAHQLALQKAMLADLVESWKILSLPRHTISPEAENELTNGFWFPNLDKFSLSLLKHAKRGDFTAAFSSLFPHYPPSQLGKPVSVLAIATYTLLHDSARCPVDVRDKATRFMSKVAHLIVYVKHSDTALRQNIATAYPELEDYIMGLWPKIRAYLSHNQPADDGRAADRRRLMPLRDNERDEKFSLFNPRDIGRRIVNTYSTRNSAEIDRLWVEFVGSDETISEAKAAQIRENPNLIDEFVKIHMAFNQPEKAMVAWNVLGKVGLKPSLRTLNLMMDGLRKAKNLNGLKNIWVKLAKSGMALDTAIWTTRVAGLIDCGDIQGGLNALEEMARLWEHKRKDPAAVEPTIGPVNAALAGLIQSQRQDVAEKLLAWADKRGIKPDIFTYNTMLRLLVRAGNRDSDVQKLLATMRSQGVSADEATYVIILDASFSKEQVRDPKKQEKIVTDIAAAMAADGLTLNMQTYGKMIYLLLVSGSTTGAMEVVNDIYKNNKELSPHIYTMLVEHCFVMNPPALDAVRLVVERRRHLDFDDMDHIFYERVARGYIQVGETSAALDIIKHVVASGASMSVPVLHDLLRGLLGQQRTQDARELVNLEKQRFEKQNPDPAGHATYWSHQFWHLAEERNLLDSKLPGSRAAADS